jgi:hypothetical protein
MSTASVKLGPLLLTFAVAAGSWCCGTDDDQGVRGQDPSSAGANEGGTNEGGTNEGGTNEHAGGAQGSAGTAGSGEAVGPGLAEICEKTCLDQAELSCAFPLPVCTQTCEAMADPAIGTQFPTEYVDMLRCHAENLGSTDYECLDMGPTMGNQIWPAPRQETVCEPETCAWTCADGTFGHYIVYLRCGCE